MAAIEFHFTLPMESMGTHTFTLKSGDCWYLSVEDNSFFSNLYQWFKGKKYVADSVVELQCDGETINGMYHVRKQIQVVQFSNNNHHTGEYYQQRYQATDNNDIPTLREYLSDIILKNGTLLLQTLDLEKLLDESLNMLSTGEYRKACLLKACGGSPKVLILEDPCPGVDAEGRKSLDTLFNHLAEQGTVLALIGTSPEIPALSNQCFVYRNGAVLYSGDPGNMPVIDRLVQHEASISYPLPWNNSGEVSYKSLVRLCNVGINYGERVLLTNVNWEIKVGEKWQLSGKNGTGKSLLLSLLFADNPQAYAKEIYLFGKRRGTGESIWDIKANIAFYSSEFFRYLNRQATVEQTLLSVVFPCPFQKKKWEEKHLKYKKELLDYFHFVDVEKKKLGTLSQDKQRLILFVAVLLKNSPLLILDEPYQDFTPSLIKRCNLLLDHTIGNRSLIFVTHNKSAVPSCVTKVKHLE